MVSNLYHAWHFTLINAILYFNVAGRDDTDGMRRTNSHLATTLSLLVMLSNLARVIIMDIWKYSKSGQIVEDIKHASAAMNQLWSRRSDDFNKKATLVVCINVLVFGLICFGENFSILSHVPSKYLISQ